MKKRIKQQMMAARSEWLRLALSLKNSDRWISVEEIYKEYNNAGVQHDYYREQLDSPSRETYRRWIGTVDFVEFKTVKGKGRGWLKRMYRLKQDPLASSCLSSLGQKVAKLGRYLFNGKCSSTIQNQSK